MYEEFIKKGYRVFHVPNAININSFPSETDRRYKKQIIYAGRLSEEKGILDLLEIVPELPKDIDLVILGTGPEVAKVEEITKKFSNVHYLGYQPKDQTIQLIRGSDLLVQPSIMEGGTSSTLLEAMVCKTPIIATRVGGNKETISHMKTAYVVNARKPHEILDAIIDLFDNPTKQNMLVENAYELVLNYDWKEIGSKYLDVYNSK